MRESKESWRLSEISGELESPKRHWLLERLAALAAPGVERELIRTHASNLEFRAKLLAAGFERRGHKIKHDGNDYSAMAVKSPGRSAQLQRLERAAKSGSLKRWLAAWASASPGTRRLIIDNLPGALRPNRGIPPSWVSFSAPDFITNAPRAANALAAVKATQAKLGTVDAQERKKRTRSAETQAFLEALKKSFFEVTGRRAYVTWSAHTEKYGGSYCELIRDINEVYGTTIPIRENPTRLTRK